MARRITLRSFTAEKENPLGFALGKEGLFSFVAIPLLPSTTISQRIKIGTTAIILALIEEGENLPAFELEDPVRAIKEISRDTLLKHSVKLSDGRQFTAIEIQKDYLDAAHRFYASHELDPMTKDILVKWESVLRRLEEEPMELSREIDWVIKKQLMLSYQERKKCDWGDPRISMMDLQYHDLRPEKGLYYALERKGFVERIVMDEEIARAQQMPPVDTRAYFRATCLKKFPNAVYAASWSSILFDVGNTTIKKIPLMEPLRGTEQLTRSLLEASNTVEELLSNLVA